MSEEKENGLIIDFYGDISLAMNCEIANNIVGSMNVELSKADFCVANLESPIVHDVNYTPIIKDGPNLYTTEAVNAFYEDLNIDCYTLANNHMGDYGVEGIRDTLDTLRRLKKEYVGASMEIERTYLPLRKEINGIKFAVFSFCENEFGVVTYDKPGVAGYKPDIIKEVLQEERKTSDYIFVVFHGGTEYYPFPTPKQKERYHMLVDWGADYVFGVHSHCPQGYEKYKGSFIFYGLGNFFFPSKEGIAFDGWNFGYGVRLFVNEKGIKNDILPYCFSQTGERFEYIKDTPFYDYLQEISTFIEDDFCLKKLFDSWCELKGESLFSELKKLIRMTDEMSKARVKNLFTCEAHNELLTNYVSFLTENVTSGDKKYSRLLLKYRQIRTCLGMDKREPKNILLENEDVNILWGVSAKSKKIASQYEMNKQVVCFVDTDVLKQGMYWRNHRILAPKVAAKIYKNATWHICTRNIFHKEIEKELLNMGVCVEKIMYINDLL